MKTYNSIDIAKYFLGKTDEDAGEVITNLKLQKLVYYAQAYYLALYGQPLFSEQVLAWQHGPVVREVYDEFKSYGSLQIPPPQEMPNIDSDIEEFLDEIYEEFGQYSAWKLREMTHSDEPWKLAFNSPDGVGSVISEESMRSFYQRFVVKSSDE